MEQQKNDSAEMDAEVEKLSRKMASFNIIRKQKQYYTTETGVTVAAEHLIQVNDVLDIILGYLIKGYYSWAKKGLITETIMSLLPSSSGMKNPQEIRGYPWSRKKDPQETVPENPGAASHTSRKITLQSSDGGVFEVDAAVALESHRMKYYVDCNSQETVPENPGAASHTSRKITLQSSDGGVFEVDEAVALESHRMKYYIDCNSADDGIPLPEVTSKILSKVIEYCKKHVESRQSDDCAIGTVADNLKAWDAEFVKVDQATLFDLIHAAHYLDIKSLSKLTCKTFLEMTETQEDFKRMFKLLMHTN